MIDRVLPFIAQEVASDDGLEAPEEIYVAHSINEIVSDVSSCYENMVLKDPDYREALGHAYYSLAHLFYSLGVTNFDQVPAFVDVAQEDPIIFAQIHQDIANAYSYFLNGNDARFLSGLATVAADIELVAGKVGVNLADYVANLSSDGKFAVFDPDRLK